jgi:hypothetical protein
MELGKPHDALLKPAQYQAARGLGAMRREGPDHLADASYRATIWMRTRIALIVARHFRRIVAGGGARASLQGR